MSLDAFLASASTALGLSLVFLYLLITEAIVPKGRLNDVKGQLEDAKVALKDALSVIKQQNDGVLPLVVMLKDLAVDLKVFLARRQR